MTLHALEIPDEPSQLPDWLERQLTGRDLALVVAELAAVHRAPASAVRSVYDLVGNQFDAVMQSGLKVLAGSVLKQLLTQPGLLLELQEAVFLHGGAHWEHRWRAEPQIEDSVARGRDRLATFLASQSSEPAADHRMTIVFRPPAEPTAASATAPVVALPRREVPWYRQAWVASCATAAVVLIALFVVEQFRGRPDQPVAVASAAWGWNKPDALPTDLSAPAYLNALADAAGEWFNKRPEDPAALAKRIAEFRQGCSVLLLAEHRALAEPDRTWLVERCRAWATKLDGHLASVESGDAALTVRAATDETITKLIEALRGRARELAA
jgi:hypothetical protein